MILRTPLSLDSAYNGITESEERVEYVSCSIDEGKRVIMLACG
jgi:hypothetical protein